MGVLSGCDGVPDNRQEGPSAGFPRTASDAVELAAAFNCEAPAKFVALTWNKASGRGGRDAKRNPIENWIGFLTAEWGFEQDRLKNLPRKQSTGAAEILAVESALKSVCERIDNMTIPSASVFPKEYAAMVKKRAPLLAEKKRLTEKLQELQAQAGEEVAR